MIELCSSQESCAFLSRRQGQELVRHQRVSPCHPPPPSSRRRRDLVPNHIGAGCHPPSGVIHPQVSSTLRCHPPPGVMLTKEASRALSLPGQPVAFLPLTPGVISTGV